MKYDALLAVIVAGCANFSVFLLRPSITSELPDLALAGLGDCVALAIGTGSGFSLADQRLSIPRETGERRVHLTERQGSASAKVGVVIAL